MKRRYILIALLIFSMAIFFCGCKSYKEATGLWQSTKDKIILQLYSEDEETKERKCTLGILDKKYEGTYEIDKKLITLHLDSDLFEDADLSYLYTIDGDTLTLTTDETEIKLKRVDVEY